MMLICVYYPYVYLLARTAFGQQSATAYPGGAHARPAGRGRPSGGSACRWRGPAIVAGVLLAIMETVADYGTVSYFNVRTFSTGIYQAWFAMQDRAAAAQLALCLLGFALLLAASSGSSGAGRSRTCAAAGWRRSSRRGSPAGGGWAGDDACALPLLVGFVLPVVDPRARWRPAPGRASSTRATCGFVGNSLTLAGLAAVRDRPRRGADRASGADAARAGLARARARRRPRLRGAGRGDRRRAAGALRRSRQPGRRLGARALRGLDRADLHRNDLAPGPRLHGALHGGRAQRLRRRPRHGQPAHRRRGADARTPPADGARRGAPADPEGQPADARS